MMDEYLRFAALVLTAVVLAQMVGRDFKVLLTLAVCVMVCVGVMTFLEPVAALMKQLRRLGGIDNEAVTILLKAALIGLVGELANLICADAGEQAMGKALQILSTVLILWLGIPLFQQILALIEGVLSEI